MAKAVVLLDDNELTGEVGGGIGKSLTTSAHKIGSVREGIIFPKPSKLPTVSYIIVITI